MNNSRFSAYNAAFWFAFENSTFVLRHMSKNAAAYEPGDFVANFHRNLSDTA
jgi:hypothetical protein